jgi:FkbM family methyltransferase
MRLTFWQKLAALAAAPRMHRQIRDILVRRYWQKKTDWKLDFHGVTATFAADDFYSNYWFYGPQNIGQAYEPPITRLIIDFARKSRFFADIGANLGYFAVVAARANANLKVVAIELDETLAPIIQKNIARNEINAEVKCGAVGDGKTVVSHQPHAYSFLSRAAGEAISMPRVDLNTRSFRLDDFFEEDLPDLVKMDVDGAELAALQNAQRMLANPELTMLLEVQTVRTPEFPETATGCGHLLAGSGFSFYAITESGLEPINDLSRLPTPGPTAMVLVTRRPLSFFGY